MSKKDRIVLTCLCVLIAFMDISGLPFGLIRVEAADIDSYIIPLMINFCLIGIISFLVLRIARVNFKLGFTKKGLKDGLKKYAPAGIIAAALSFTAFFVGLYPFDYSPSVWKILVEGVLYYIGVGIVEEFYVRGLFLNIIEDFARKNKNKALIAIIVSSSVFGLGHIPGMLGMGAGVIVFKLISTIGMGLYFGTIYKKSGNLWLPIIMHTLIDVGALPYCFTRDMRYENISLVILHITYTALSVYCGFVLLHNKSREGN